MEHAEDVVVGEPRRVAREPSRAPRAGAPWRSWRSASIRPKRHWAGSRRAARSRSAIAPLAGGALEGERPRGVEGRVVGRSRRTPSKSRRASSSVAGAPVDERQVVARTPARLRRRRPGQHLRRLRPEREDELRRARRPRRERAPPRRARRHPGRRASRAPRPSAARAPAPARVVVERRGRGTRRRARGRSRAAARSGCRRRRRAGGVARPRRGPSRSGRPWLSGSRASSSSRAARGLVRAPAEAADDGQELAAPRGCAR